jgi:adenosylmethionine-8-amino-7-oxononanoate aminotransferase
VIGAGGLYPPEPGYLEGLRALCDASGAWLILDEVICGFGRLGHWWGAERFGVRPDLQTFAKAVTSGYLPLGGVVTGPRVLEALDGEPDLVFRHGHTYSGHPTACAAALAVLGITRDEDLLGRASAVGKRLRDGLVELRGRGLLAEVRGDGAMWAAGLHGGVDAATVRDGLLRRGVIARPIGTSTITFCPPLVTSEGDLDTCVEALADTLAGTAGPDAPP